MIFYKHYLGDYDGDTAHLSWLEDMAYTRLMRLYYRREQPIPGEIGQACRLIRANTKQEREAVESVLREFFTLESDGWHNKRCDAEIAASGKKAEANRNNGGKGGRPRKNKTETEPTENPLGYSSVPKETHSEPTQNLSQTSDVRCQNSESETDTALTRGARLPDRFEEVRMAYPKRAGDQRWKQAEQTYRRRLKSGQSHEQILAAVRRYAAFVRAKGDEGAEHVKQAATFLNADENLEHLWQPPPTRGQLRQNRNISAAQTWLEQQEANDASH
jgi:uncharacterized protein YdaU (DUF1376 family)